MKRKKSFLEVSIYIYIYIYKEESTNTIEEEVKMEELSKRLGMSVTHGSNPIYIKGFEQSIIYTKTLEAMKFMNTGKDKELAYLCSVSLHPEIQVIRLQLDLNFLDVSQAILDNLGFVFTETVNILLEYQVDVNIYIYIYYIYILFG